VLTDYTLVGRSHYAFVALLRVGDYRIDSAGLINITQASAGLRPVTFHQTQQGAIVNAEPVTMQLPIGEYPAMAVFDLHGNALFANGLPKPFFALWVKELTFDVGALSLTQSAFDLLSDYTYIIHEEDSIDDLIA